MTKPNRLFLLVFALALLLTACGGTPVGEVVTDDLVVEEDVNANLAWTITEIVPQTVLPIQAGLDGNMMDVRLIDTTAYLYLVSWDDQSTEQIIVPFCTQTMAFLDPIYAVPDGVYVDQIQTWCRIGALAQDAGGTLWFPQVSTTTDLDEARPNDILEQDVTLIQLSPEGDVLQRIPLDRPVDAGWYWSHPSTFFVFETGFFLCYIPSDLARYDTMTFYTWFFSPEGTLIHQDPSAAFFFSSFQQEAHEVIGIQYRSWGAGGSEMRRFDIELGRWGDDEPLPDEIDATPFRGVTPPFTRWEIDPRGLHQMFFYFALPGDRFIGFSWAGDAYLIERR